MTLAIAKPRNSNSPIDHQIRLKEKLILRLRKEIKAESDECERRIKNIEFRIQMAQTLLEALKKGR